MRTLQVLNVRWFNATAWYGLFLAALLRDAGHPTQVLTLPGTDTHRKALEWGFQPLALNINTANPLAQPGLLRALGRELRAFRPDVVNCHRGEGFALFGLLRRAGVGGFRLVRTRGDQRPPKANSVNRFLHARAADALIATNSRMKRALTQAMRPDPDRVFMIPGGVDTTRFYFDPVGRERVRREFAIPERAFVVGLLGRLDPVKGHADLIAAVAGLRGLNRDVRLLLLGAPANLSAEDVRTWIDAAGLNGRARITGRRPDVNACLSALDLGVVASRGSETIARAALEIMATGRPLLSTDVGVMPDILSPEALTRPGDADALRERMVALLSDSQYARRLMEQQARRLSSLTGAAFLEQTLKAYTRALAD